MLLPSILWFRQYRLRAIVLLLHQNCHLFYLDMKEAIEVHVREEIVVFQQSSMV